MARLRRGRRGRRRTDTERPARKYLFEGGDQARSAEVAIADIDCQQQFDLEGVWYRTVTEYDRSLMGADVGLYDEQVRLLQQTVDLARRELTDRNIEVPTIRLTVPTPTPRQDRSNVRSAGLLLCGM